MWVKYFALHLVILFDGYFVINANLRYITLQGNEIFMLKMRHHIDTDLFSTKFASKANFLSSSIFVVD